MTEKKKFDIILQLLQGNGAFGMKRCIITVVFTLLVCFGLVSTGFAASARYTDVPAQHWAADSIHRASELGIFQGPYTFLNLTDGSPQ